MGTLGRTEVMAMQQMTANLNSNGIIALLIAKQIR